MRIRPCIRHDDKAASWLTPKGDDGRFDLYVVPNRRPDCSTLSVWAAVSNDGM
jgi:hypothetical protein